MATCGTGKLVNAFGDITLDITNRDTNEILLAILVELRIMNTHLASMTDERITEAEIERYGD